jgi:hypothetical protein
MSPKKRYTADQPATRAVSTLIEEYGARVILAAVADYCQGVLELRCFAAGFECATEELSGREDVCACGHPARHHLADGSWAHGCTCHMEPDCTCVCVGDVADASECDLHNPRRAD